MLRKVKRRTTIINGNSHQLNQFNDDGPLFLSVCHYSSPTNTMPTHTLNVQKSRQLYNVTWHKFSFCFVFSLFFCFVLFSCLSVFLRARTLIIANNGWAASDEKSSAWEHNQWMMLFQYLLISWMMMMMIIIINIIKLAFACALIREEETLRSFHNDMSVVFWRFFVT